MTSNSDAIVQPVQNDVQNLLGATARAPLLGHRRPIPWN